MPSPRLPWVVLRWLAAAVICFGALGLVGATSFTDAHTLATAGLPALDPAFVWHKWDAIWYERIAVHGYQYELETLKGQAAAGFFPLYPLVVGGLLRVLPGVPFFWAASAVSMLATFAALLLVARHLADGLDEVRRVLLVLLTSAGAFYLAIPYTEGLFLLLVVLTLVLTRREHYVAAALVAGLAAVTRVQGLALVAVPVVACLQDGRLTTHERRLRAGAAALLFAVPFGVYLGWMSALQGAALAFVDRQALWSNATPYPLRAIAGLIEHPRWVNGWLHGGFWCVYAALLIRYRRRLPLGEVLFCAGALLISTQQEIFQGIYRYVTPLVPLTLAVANDRADIRQRLIAFNLVFAVLMLLAFVTNHRLAV